MRLNSAVECYYNHTITRISIQTAGLAFGGTGLCSYRVRGVDGSCTEHLTVESYTVIICQQSYLLLLVFHHHSLFHSRVKTFLFCKSFPPQLFLFFYRIYYMDSPDCLLLLLSISVTMATGVGVTQILFAQLNSPTPKPLSFVQEFGTYLLYKKSYSKFSVKIQ